MSTFQIVTFGCQMNQHDSERLSEVLREAGHVAVDQVDQADVIVLNTCSVREKAEHKLRSEVGRLAMVKRQRPGLVLAVAGCVAQQEGEALLRRMPDLDLVVGPDNLAELPSLLRSLELGGPPAVRARFDIEAPQFLRAQPSGRAKASAFVTVMKGCDERCSYCIVPTTRGPERYRPSSDVLDEVARLVDAGVREVTLLGQTVNSYRDPEGALARHGELGDDESEFPRLLRSIAERVPGLVRLRYTSPHPRHLTADLVQAHVELGVLARHVHMPVQSGSDRMLKRMIRRYTAADYVDRVEALRRSVPGLTLSTDVIVGFPGETREDFDKTLALVDRIGFVGLFGFKYSPRPHTPALRLGDDVSEEEKSRRLTELFRVAEPHRRRHLESLVGTVQRVLVERMDARGACTGRTEQNEIVHFGCSGDPTGEMVDVRIAAAFKNSLSGELTDVRRARPLPPRRPESRRRSLPMLAAETG